MARSGLSYGAYEHLILSFTITRNGQDLCAPQTLLAGTNIADEPINSDCAPDAIPVQIPYFDSSFIGFHLRPLCETPNLFGVSLGRDAHSHCIIWIGVMARPSPEGEIDFKFGDDPPSPGFLK